MVPTEKMGQITCKTLAAHTDFELVGAIGSSTDLTTEINKTAAQVVVDFTNATAVFKNTETIINTGAHPVIGTSGLMKSQIESLTKALCTT